MDSGLVCEEMTKLREYLDDRNIPWSDETDILHYDNGEICWFVCRTYIELGEKYIHVKNGFGTIGGVNFETGINEGLLEIEIQKSDPRGYLVTERSLTAEEVIKKIEEMR